MRLSERGCQGMIGKPFSLVLLTRRWCSHTKCIEDVHSTNYLAAHLSGGKVRPIMSDRRSEAGRPKRGLAALGPTRRLLELMRNGC